MKRSSRAALSVALLLCVGQAGAQDLGAYQALTRALDAAAQSSGHDAVRTLSYLDAAQQAFGRLSPSLGSSQIVSDMRDALDAARAAQSRTPAELQAQLLLARGLLRKALYDQTVTVLATSPENATERLSLLALEVGADPQALVADARAGKVNLVTWRLQKAAAEKVGASLAQVQPRQTSGNYLNLARASSWFTVVQDTGRNLTPPLDAPQFQDALSQLAAGNTVALTTSLSRLKTGAGALNRALATVPTAHMSVAPVASPAQSAPKVTGVKPSGGAAGGGAAGGPVVGGGLSHVPGAGGLNGAYAALGRALSAAGHADMVKARRQLATVPGVLATAPAGLRHAAGYDAFTGHAQALAARQGLRPADVQALTAELGALESRAAGRPVSVLDTLSGRASRLFGGGLRAVLGLLLALACAAPLYLLNLAFGNRNPFWRAINTALALLLLPTVLEGVFGFLGWVGDLTGAAFLRSLTNLTLLQAAYGLPIRGLLSLVAIALATYGFRGLCIQFGLLGTRPSQKNKTKISPVVAVNPDHTSLDWDEEV
ncbi:hypothetical protein [Deinococcus sp.]|uniref:hypothetical protein n=1 Tax=Deinococcus sp. TaxID=47478 RepID=UPI0025BE3076|nr:hypothetical protein [Deinococcus sp.]